MKTLIDHNGKEYEYNENSYFVTMTDKYLSGWGKAENLISKRIIICDSFQIARAIKNGIENIRDSNGMRYINITNKKPYYNNNRYITSIDNWKQCILYIENSDFKSFLENNK